MSGTTGWHEFIAYPQATTHIAYVYEDGSIYLPEGRGVVDLDDFAMANASGAVFPLVRASELAAAERRGAVKALREAADEIDSILYQRRRTLGGTTPDWLNARADRIEKEAGL